MSDESLPPPPVPAEVDLAGYGFMPLHGHRLFGSDFNAVCTDAEWRAGVTLWWASWNQVPASSLPDDDVALCRLAQLGRDVKGWRKLRANALRGFVRCSDGRLYHPVLARLALDAWDRRVRDRERKARWRERVNLSSDGPQDADGDGDRDGDVRVEAKRSERDRDRERENSPAAAAAAAAPETRAATPAASKRISGVDLKALREAIAAEDVIGVAAAFGANVEGGRRGEWPRDADGLSVTSVAILLGWKRHQRTPIREPSGFRQAIAEWRDQVSEAYRRDVSATVRKSLGLPLAQPQTTPPEVAP